MEKHFKSTNGSISPPPLPRRKPSPIIAPTQGTQRSAGNFASTPGTLSIVSWNVNGIAPFVQDYLQKPISAFFKPSSAAGKKRRRGATGDDVTTDSEDDGSKEAAETGDPMKEGKASPRAALLRYRWPHILFLQEVKIKANDAKTMAAVRVAVNNAGGPIRSDHMRNARGHFNGTGTRKKGPHAAWLEDGGPEYDVQFNLPADPRNAKGFGGKVYGVAAIIRKDFMHRYVQSVREVAWDREGRVQIIETWEVPFPLDPDPEAIPTSVGEQELSNETSKKGGAEFAAKFAIINIYAVNGTSNPHYNTQTGVQVGTRHDRKLALHTELLREAHALQRNGFQVIIAGDLNVARNELDGYPNLRTWPHQHVLNRLDFNTKFFTKQSIKHISSRASYSRDTAASMEEPIQGFDGIDTFRHLHGTERRYSYYPRGRPWGSSCDRVDLIIASRDLSDHIVAAGISDNPRDRGPSDHCPIWVEIGCRSIENRASPE
ncbi:hypothetical protein DL769_001090 [Monosporascus sp. CRB-8-3]|nr:hypothetical protein DL769_001090 [Monosporascus sp. CRB-8-3]